MKSKGKSRTIYVHEEDYEYLRQIGGGYAEGLRRAVQAHRATALVLKETGDSYAEGLRKAVEAHKALMERAQQAGVKTR